jgi:hypothetical protein
MDEILLSKLMMGVRKVILVHGGVSSDAGYVYNML